MKNTKTVASIALSLVLALGFSFQANAAGTAASQATIAITAGTQTIDIVDAAGTTVGSPLVSMSAITVNIFATQQSTGAFSVTNEKMRVYNPTNDNVWTVAIAETNQGSGWVGTTYTMSTNEPGVTTSTNRGSGQLTINASAVSANEVINNVAASGMTFPGGAFSGAITSVTLVNSTTSTKSEAFDITGYIFEQDIPVGQYEDTYTLDLTLTLA